MTHVTAMTAEKLLDFVGNKTAENGDPFGKARAEILARITQLEADKRKLLDALIQYAEPMARGLERIAKQNGNAGMFTEEIKAIQKLIKEMEQK